MASRRTKLLALGASSTLAGLLLAASFQFISDHRWYWNTAPLLCVLVLLGTVFGGFLVGRSLAGARNTRLWVVVVGALLGFVWLATGILAAVLGALGMCYVPGVEGHVGWETYSSSFLFSGAPIRFLQIASGTGFIAGAAVGFGLAWRRVSAALSRTL